MALTVIKPSGIDTSGNYTVNGMNVSANISVANLSATTSANLGAVGNITITGGSSGQVLSTNGSGGLSFISVSSSGISNGNSNVDIATANGNVTISSAGNTTMTVTGTGANITGTANITGNIVGGGELNISGNSIFGGNLTVNGTLTYINSTTLSISDPIINLQTGANGAAPIANTGKDVGTALNYYDTSAKIAWMGWDVSNAEIAFGSNVGISSEVVTFTSLANIRSGNANLGNLATANFFTGSGNNLSNIQASNITGQVANALVAGTVYTNAQPNITSVGTLTTLSVSGNANVGNIGATSGIFTDVSGNGSTLSSITGGNVTGQVGNALVAGTVYTNAQPNITSTGTLTSVSSSGNVTGANLITGGIVSATGNITASFFIGNGSQLTGLNTAGVSNGNSNVNIATANGNVTIASAGNTTMTITGTGANITGTLSATANITGGNLITTGIVSATGNVSFGNADLGNLATANFFTGTLTTAAQPNITSTGTLASLSVSGTSNLGNVGNVKITGGTSGQVLSTDGAGNLTFADTASGNSAAPMPYVVSVGESYTVPENFQGLFTVPITIDGELEIDGILAEVGTAINSQNSQIIFDDNGELTGNTGFTFDTVSGNLAVPGSAIVSSILTNNYYYANGQPLSFGGAPGGSTTQLQYNNAGSFGGISTATYSGGQLSLGSNAQVKITGGTIGQVLSTDGAGNLSWANGGGSTGFLSITSRSGIIEVNISAGYLNIVGRSGTIPIPIS